MAEFDTTKMTQNRPELTYVTPKAMPAKFSNLGAVASLADTAIKGAVALDKRMTLTQAEQEAEDLRQQYQNTSPTAIAQLEEEKTRLEASMETEGPAPYQEELDTVINKLEMAKEQKVMSPSEFQYRANAVAEELISRNPAYADEITAQMSSVYKRGGLNTLLKSDLASMEAQQKAQAKQFAEMTKFLDTQHISWRQRPEEVPYLFEKEQQYLRNKVEESRLIAADERFSEEQKIKFLANMGDGVGGTNGLYMEAEKSWNLLYNQLEFIEDNIQNVDEQNDARQRLTEAARRELQWTVSNLPARNEYEKKRNEDFYTMQLNAINKLDEEMQKIVPANRKAFLKEKIETIELEQKLHEVTANGFNKAAAENLKLTIDTYVALTTGGNGKLLDLLNESNPEEMVKIKQAMEEIITRKGSKLNYQSDNGQYYGEKTQLNNYSSYKSFNDLAEAEIAFGDLTDGTKGYFNNVFNIANSMTGDLKNKELDKLLPRISSTSDKVFDNLMSQPDFSKDVLDNVEFYKEATKTTLPEGSNVVVKNGMVYAPTDARLNNNLTRVNEYIKIQAKLRGEKPSSIVDEILKTDFPMLTTGKTVDTQEMTTEPTPPTVEANTELEQAKEWLKNNPNDPDAEAVRKKIESMS
ncbi:hypothetical protein MEP402_gp32 [Methylophilales phage MEP402]|nr:hypothetical protein MEP402_gp32 [Methylophilales phage MEP402]